MTDEEWCHAIRAFVDGDGSYPELADLPAWWDSLSPEARARNLPNYSARHVLVAGYINWAFTKRWAWVGLNRLLVTLQERREGIPDVLKDWACSVVSRQFQGKRVEPPKPRNPRYAPKDDRDVRVMRIYHVMREAGWTEQQAKEEIMRALDHIDADTVRSVFRKMQTFQPFKSGGTKAPK